MLRLESAAVCTAEGLCVFEKKFFEETALEILDFQSFPFLHRLSAKKSMLWETAHILRQSDNRFYRIKRKRLKDTPVGILYNAIDDLEEKLLRNCGTARV